MVHFLGFSVPGIPNGCTYALFAIGLILTYQATGVFNFAFAAQAYTSAFVYGLLCLHGWPVWLAFVISVVLLAPALGLAFDYFLFRRIPNTNSTAKVVTGISLLVGIPSLLTVIFGNQQLDGPPSLLFNANTVYFHLFGVSELPINGIDLGTVIVTVVVLVAMVILLRYTSMGLKMRASVESRRLVQLDGVNAVRVVSVSWAVSSFLAGLAGVLFAHQLAPVQPENYQLLLITAIAAAAWGRLRSMPIAALVAIAAGRHRVGGPRLPADRRLLERGGRAGHPDDRPGPGPVASCPGSGASTTPRTRWPRSTPPPRPPRRPRGPRPWTGSSGPAGRRCWPSSSSRC